MRHPSCRMTTKRHFCALVAVFILHLKSLKTKVDCRDRVTSSSVTKFDSLEEEFEQICDEAYTLKYLDNDKSKEIELFSIDDTDSAEFMDVGWNRRSNLDKHENDGNGTARREFGSILKSRRYESRNELEAIGKGKKKEDGWADNVCNSVRRIVGGSMPVSVEEFPYLVFLDSGCGGAIIGHIWVLTAAHCIDETEPEYIHAGSLDLLGGCQYNVEKLYIHPQYDRKLYRYDIGLLTTAPGFVYSPAIKPIKLSRRHARYKMCGVVAGWGAEAYQAGPTYRLSMTLIPVISRRKCRMFPIRRGQFCAGYTDARSDTCQGDSGGPFVVAGRLVGIVSYGFKCATPRAPGVYSDVYHYRKWIRCVSGIS